MLYRSVNEKGHLCTLIGFNCHDPIYIKSLHPVNNRNYYSTTCVSLSPILLAYENGDFPAISVPQNGSVAQEAPNLHNQAKVCHFQPIEKLACGMPQ